VGRSIIEQYPAFRLSVLGKLLANFSFIQANNVLGVAIWQVPHPTPASPGRCAGQSLSVHPPFGRAR
jgi:hypothetical protein